MEETLPKITDFHSEKACLKLIMSGHGPMTTRVLWACHRSTTNKAQVALCPIHVL